ncbi:MAG: AMP-binding protein [Thermoleophilia bacterium]|nr:AMP-binding protein [Thermoleophilia bacterium]
MTQLLEGVVPYREEDAARYVREGWWRGLTLGDLLDRAAAIQPDKTGFVDLYRRLTYREAKDQADRLAIALLRWGLRPLDRVLVQLPNWTEFVPIYFALQKIGAIPVMLIDRYRQFEIQQLAALSGARAWVVPMQHRKVDFLPIIRDVLEVRPQIEYLITVRGQALESQTTLFGNPALKAASLENLIAQTAPTAEELAHLKQLRPHPGQIAHMGPTGGTTGNPKIVPRTHDSLECGVEHCSYCWDQHCEDVNLIVGSIGHDLSFTKGFLGSVITMGTIVLLDTTDAETICRVIQDERVTAIVWVPTLTQRLLDYEGLCDHDLSSLRKIHSGGGAAHPDLIRAVFSRLGVRFYNGYGGTEGMTTITRPTDDVETVCSTVGRPTCPGDTYKVVAPSGAALPPGMQGELVVKGPGVFTGYYNNPEENARVFDAEGFFHTGDLAKINERGYITITGRLKEMINRGGESISATVIEELIARHPGVAAVAVVPMPCPIMGERACAYIQPRPGARLDFDSIIAFLRDEQKASVLELPERIEFVQAMPLTAAQKIDKRVLKQDIAEKVAAERASQAAGKEASRLA